MTQQLFSSRTSQVFNPSQLDSRNYFKADFLVIGGGLAGLTFAIKVAKYGTVNLITKKGILDSSTTFAQGGIASVFNEEDSFDLHINDTLSSGDGLCHLEVVDMVIKNGPERIKELIKLGVKFDTEELSGLKQAQRFDLGREGGHSRNRVFHTHDMTGIELATVLMSNAKADPNITIYENHMAIDFITYSTMIKSGLVTTNRDDFCCGAYVLDTKNNQVKTFDAKITLLASGGSGKVYKYTSNPDVATGDGIAMAYRAGASVANLEFVQFHPTCIYHADAKNFLISEAVRGEGAKLIDFNGECFMEKYSPLKELACRDIVSRAIDTELKKSGKDSVFLDISHKPSDFIKKRFPNLYAKCMEFGFDMTREPIPVVPAAHYMCGGVATDLFGRTDISRLYVVGETACTGLHGANRLASNSLLEALVYANTASIKAIEELKKVSPQETPIAPAWDDSKTIDSHEVIMVSHTWEEIRQLMWNYIGVVRSDKMLQRAVRRIDIIQKEIYEYYWDFKVTSDLLELRNIATVAELIIKCATIRKESRGLHYNVEYPEKNDQEWLTDTILKRDKKV